MQFMDDSIWEKLQNGWVTPFEAYMKYLHDEKCTVIAMRDLAKYVDPKKRPNAKDPYEAVRQRTEALRKK